MRSPSSSNSFFNIHILLNDAKWDKIDPPYQLKVILSGGAQIFTLASFGTNLFTSPINLSGNPYIMDVPPVNTISLYNGFLKSRSTFYIEFAKISGIEFNSRPYFSGHIKISGALYFSKLNSMVLLSGNIYWSLIFLSS